MPRSWRHPPDPNPAERLPLQGRSQISLRAPKPIAATELYRVICDCACSGHFHLAHTTRNAARALTDNTLFVARMSARPVFRTATRTLRPSLSCSCSSIRSARTFSTSFAAQKPATNNSNTSNSTERTTHFGFEDGLSEAEKTARVADVFHSVAESYDKMNDLMSFGWHRIWK